MGLIKGIKRKVLPLLLSMAMASSTAAGLAVVPEISAKAETVPQAATLAREAAGEGMVLLKNEDHVLPFTPDETVSVFGRVQVDTFVCGYGSGGGITAPYKVMILEGLRKNGNIKINEELASIYEEWCAKNPPDQGSWGNWPYYYPEMPLTDEIVNDARAASDVAMVVIGRAAGEDRECKLEPGSYYLTDDEKDMLEKVNAAFDKVVVLMDIGNVMDMSWVDDYENIKALLYTWQGGMEMGNAVADVLSGDVTPSGKLSMSIAKSYEDYPSAANFGGSAKNNYVEDIYVGYRYFETFAQDKVLYPFGYGLSYTDFDIQAETSVEDDTITVTAKVTNTGEMSGKEVVQVYYGAPQGVLGKAARSLAGYVKTEILAPGDSQTVTVSFPVENMASYDDAGKTGHKSAWVLEAGDYPIYVGNSVRSAVLAGSWNCPELTVTEQLEEASAVEPEMKFQRMTAAEENGEIVLKYEDVPTATVDLAERVKENLPEAVPMTGDQGIKLMDVYNGKNTMDEFIAQLTPVELEALLRGDYTKTSSLGTSGNASVYGGTIQSLRDKGIPALSTVDGPVGIKSGEPATLAPIGTLLACTWNDPLVEKLYNLIGEEMCLNDFDALLGPGMNLQRNPLCGRNFEYFSEDPLLTGQMAAAETRGLQYAGVSSVPKHFALNNQESWRHSSDSVCSERAERELYLRGFEICLKTSKPYNLMASYNKINGEWSHYNYELATTILRDQWGYEGLLMTDWWLSRGKSEELYVEDNAYRVRAQVDVNMPGEGPNGSGAADTSLLDSYNNWVAAGSPEGTLEYGVTLGEMQRSARNVLNYVLDSYSFRADNGLENTYEPGEDWFTTNASPWKEKPQLDSLTISGMDFAVFDPMVNNYDVFVRDMSQIPTVSAHADGAEVTITRATPESPIAIIKVAAEGQQNIYRIYFSNEAGMDPVVPDPVYARAMGIRVDGKEIAEFYPTIYEYTVVGDAATSEITVDVPEGVTATFSRDPEAKRVLVRTESDDQAMEYVLNFKTNTPPQSDDFEDGTIADNWYFYNKNENLKEENGEISIQTEGGEWYGTGSDKNNMKNVMYQYASGNWTATVKLVIPTPGALAGKDTYQFGICVFDDPDNYIDMNYCAVSWSATNQRLQVRREENGSCNDKLMDETLMKLPITENWSEKDQVTCYMQVTKENDLYIFRVKSENMSEFEELGRGEISFLEPKFGLYASHGNAGAPSVKVRFDDLTITDYSEEPGKEVEPTIIKKNGTTKLWAVNDVYRTGGMIDEPCQDEETIGYAMGSTGAGKFAIYSINVEEDGWYDVSTRVAQGDSNELGQYNHYIELDGEMAAFYSINPTGGWQTWKTTSPQRVYLTKGAHKLRLVWEAVTNLNYIQFTSTSDEVKEELSEMIRFMEGLSKEEYTSESWAVLEEALEAAKAVEADADATRVQIDEAMANLVKAFGGLEYGVQKQHLQAAVDAACAILEEEKNYDPESIAALKAIVEQAQQMLADPAATQDAVNKMTSDVIDAIVQVAFDDDLLSLESLLQAVESLNADKYTSESWAALQAAVEEAKAVLADSDREDGALANAYTQLAEAIRGLVMRGNKAALAAVIEKANEILEQASDYTESSISGLDEAVKAAEEVYNNEDATQAEVSEAVKALTEVLVQARRKGDVNQDGEVSTKDSTALLRYNAEIDSLDKDALEGADVNGDGVANTKDAALILQYASEKIAQF